MSKIFDSIKQKTTDLVFSSNTSILDNAAIELAAPEIERRKKLILKAYNRLEKANEELPKIQPDLVTYDLDGTENKGYTANTFNKKKQLTVEIDKLITGLEKAMDEKSPDYGILSSLFKDNKETKPTE
jgi:hypothetical protein